MKFPETYSDLVDLIYERASHGPKLLKPYFLSCRCGGEHDDEVYEEWCLECVKAQCAERNMHPDDYDLVEGAYTHPLYCAECRAPLETESLDDVGIEMILNLFEGHSLKENPHDWQNIKLAVDSLGSYAGWLDDGTVPRWMSTFDWEEALRRWRRVKAIVTASLLGTTANVAISFGMAENPDP